MTYFRTALIILFGLICNLAFAQVSGEASEPSPEELDAAFTEEDAAREVALHSDVIIDRSPVDPIRRMTDAADLVFRGSVASQSFIYDTLGLPFTQTTFTIEEVIEGDYSQSEITLTQEGGPSQTDAENIVIVSDARHFSEGEEELLFLELDLDSAAAENRVSIKQRFRIHNGRVYGEDGRGLIMQSSTAGAGRRLVWSSDRHPAPRFKQIHIGSHTLTKNFSDKGGAPDSSDGDGSQARQATPGYLNGVDVGTFSAAIAE